MRLITRLGLLLAGILVFAFFFIIGASITETTPKLLVYATGIYKWDYEPQDQTVVYYSNGEEMDRIGYKRIYREDFPSFLKDAVVAVEDRRFYEHSGLDTKSIGRAVWTNIRAGRKAEGASTITQQLARTLFLTQEKTYTRKIKEIFLATAIEEKYSKEAILNMYLNEIYMGRGCSGMAVAAKSYFGKDINDLNKAEITMLVGIIQAPEYYSPDRNMEGVRERQSVVANVLAEQGLLSDEEAQAIKNQSLYIEPFKPAQTNHPYYMSYLTQQLEQVVGAERLYHGGLRIYTTVDKKMQNAAERAIKDQARNLANQGITAHDMALVSIDPATGAIKALVGGVDFSKNQYNMAVLPRQPGSAIKPLYYGAAMDEGLISADTVLNNKPRSFNGYLPHNSGNSPDKVTVRQALVNSYNVASVEVLEDLGVDRAMDYLTRYGITTLEEEDKNLAALGLGGMTKGISPLQMASAYTVFANEGKRYDYYTIDRILDLSGNVIYLSHPRVDRVISSRSASLIDDILTDVVRYGTGTSARISLTSGGKTGTTTNSKDLWYVGYTSELVTAIWAGNSDNSDVKGYSTFGGKVCAPVWRNYMNSLYYNNVLKEKTTSRVREEYYEPPVQEEEKTPDDTTLEETPDEESDSTEGTSPDESSDDADIPEDINQSAEPPADSEKVLEPPDGQKVQNQGGEIQL
ncbi:MAG: transglycosylase domain-containing protein [Syntrophomonadaceae bacterium]|jgi:penicillin-binding protein 1A